MHFHLICIKCMHFQLICIKCTHFSYESACIFPEIHAFQWNARIFKRKTLPCRVTFISSWHSYPSALGLHTGRIMLLWYSQSYDLLKKNLYLTFWINMRFEIHITMNSLMYHIFVSKVRNKLIYPSTYFNQDWYLARETFDNELPRCASLWQKNSLGFCTVNPI